MAAHIHSGRTGLAALRTGVLCLGPADPRAEGMVHREDDTPGPSLRTVVEPLEPVAGVDVDESVIDALVAVGRLEAVE